MTFKQLFLPGGILVATCLSLLLPSFGLRMQEWGAISFFVFTIFLINGWEFKLTDAKLGKSFVAAFLLAVPLSLFAGPLIGVILAKQFALEPMFALGLVVMSAVPVTLSSATVMAELSGGNRAWALLMTIGLNLVGVFTLPYLLVYALGEVSEISLSASHLLVKLVILVLLPFFLGSLVRRFFRQIRSHTVLSYLPSLCVILTVYAGFSAARELLLGVSWMVYPRILGAALGVHLSLMLLAVFFALLLCLARPERNAFLFVSSQKTLPIALSVIALMSGSSPAAMIPCLIFHFTQLFVDSFIASTLSKPSIARADAPQVEVCSGDASNVY
jgi:sodium/bile acid cotransporter 7